MKCDSVEINYTDNFLLCQVCFVGDRLKTSETFEDLRGLQRYLLLLFLLNIR
jgi:hypothetical protein